MKPAFRSTNQRNRLPLFASFLSTAALALTQPVQAEDYPLQPIKIVVPSVPGSAPDTLARLMAEKLGSQLGQKILVENKPGAGGAIALDTVARAAPDGYVLGLAHDGNMAINTVVYKKLSYRPVEDFKPIAPLGFNEFVLVANPSLNIRNFADFLAFARKQQGKSTYGSAGVGSPNHLFMEQIMQQADIQLAHVPYKGGPAAMQDLLSGQIDFMLVGLSPALPHITAGKLQAVAVPQASRSKLLPAVPTVGESLPGFATKTWFGLFGPARLDSKIVAKLNQEVTRVLNDPAIRERIAMQGMVAESGSPETLATMVRDDIERYRALATLIKLEAN